MGGRPVDVAHCLAGTLMSFWLYKSELLRIRKRRECKLFFLKVSFVVVLPFKKE